jgi:hypothetical protein
METEEITRWAAEIMADPVSSDATVKVRASRRPTNTPELFLWIVVGGRMVQNDSVSLSAWQDALRLALDGKVQAV